MEELFEDKFEAPIGHKVEYLNFLFNERKESREPVFAWMKTSNTVWHRFFIDAWLPHWNDKTIEEAKEYYHTNNIENYINEELEEYNDGDGNKWVTVNVLKTYDLIGKKIFNAESKYFKLNGFWCTQLKIDIEGNNELILNNFGDIKESELIINGKKL